MSRQGRREYIIRWITRPTRRLHPAADCLRGASHTIETQALWRDESGRAWRCFVALRGGERLQIRERIHDADGGAWTDVSAWYWSASLGKSAGLWWAITTAQPQADQWPEHAGRLHRMARSVMLCAAGPPGRAFRSRCRFLLVN